MTFQSKIRCFEQILEEFSKTRESIIVQLLASGNFEDKILTHNSLEFNTIIPQKTPKSLHKQITILKRKENSLDENKHQNSKYVCVLPIIQNRNPMSYETSNDVPDASQIESKELKTLFSQSNKSVSIFTPISSFRNYLRDPLLDFELYNLTLQSEFIQKKIEDFYPYTKHHMRIIRDIYGFNNIPTYNHKTKKIEICDFENSKNDFHLPIKEEITYRQNNPNQILKIRDINNPILKEHIEKEFQEHIIQRTRCVRKIKSKKPITPLDLTTQSLYLISKPKFSDKLTKYQVKTKLKEIEQQRREELNDFTTPIKFSNQLEGYLYYEMPTQGYLNPFENSLEHDLFQNFYKQLLLEKHALYSQELTLNQNELLCPTQIPDPQKLEELKGQVATLSQKLPKNYQNKYINNHPIQGNLF